jgi:branched-chain amino acid aminotransferase
VCEVWKDGEMLTPLNFESYKEAGGMKWRWSPVPVPDGSSVDLYYIKIAFGFSEGAVRLRRMPMAVERIVFIDGSWVPWDQAKVHIMSHSFARGSGIFEVLSFHETSGGPAVFRLDEHLDRLFRSARFLEMEIPLTKDALSETVCEAVRKNRLSSGAIKVMCYYPQCAFDILPPTGQLSTAVFVVDPEIDLDSVPPVYEKGVSLCVSGWLKLDPATVPTEAKVAANYLNGMMAALEAVRRGYDKAVMKDRSDAIAESGTSSVFIVKDGALLTPSPGNILRSITRKSVLPIAEACGVETVEARISMQMCMEADEMFMSSTNGKILPVNRFEEIRLPGAEGPVTGRLWSRFQSILSGKDPAFSNWLFPVN